MLAKSLTCKSNVRRKRIVIAVLRRKDILEKSKIQNFHPDLADPESLTDSSERSHLLLETLNGENQADVSSAREKAITPKIVPTKGKNLFGWLSIFKPLQTTLPRRMN